MVEPQITLDASTLNLAGEKQLTSALQAATEKITLVSLRRPHRRPQSPSC